MSIKRFVDIDAAAERLAKITAAGKVPESAKEAVSQYLTEYQIIKAGKNPDADDAFES